jgi:hypothetical protein
VRDCAGLTAGIGYKVHVRHANACGDGTWSDYVNFTTVAAAVPNTWPRFVYEVSGTHYLVVPDEVA